jgi:hypothetical protein
MQKHEKTTWNMHNHKLTSIMKAVETTDFTDNAKLPAKGKKKFMVHFLPSPLYLYRLFYHCGRMTVRHPFGVWSLEFGIFRLLSWLQSPTNS